MDVKVFWLADLGFCDVRSLREGDSVWRFRLRWQYSPKSCDGSPQVCDYEAQFRVDLAKVVGQHVRDGQWPRA